MADLDNDGRWDLLYTWRGCGYKGDVAVGRLFVKPGLADGQFGVTRCDVNGDGTFQPAINAAKGLQKQNGTCTWSGPNDGRRDAKSSRGGTACLALKA